MSAVNQDKVIERFWNHVDKSAGGDACWLWTGLRAGGYGHMKYRESGKPGHLLAHRFSYALAYGCLDRSLYVCHRCDNPPCVNPSHLFAGTPKDNQMDAKRKGRRASKVGELCGQSKLREGHVVFIRYMHGLGVPVKSIAPIYGISETTIYRVVNRRGWTHI